MLKRIAFGSVGLLLLASPLLVSAQSISDLQAQIQALLAQIAAMQGQQSTTPPLPPINNADDYPSVPLPGSSCPKLSITMQRGSRDATTGNQVSELQIYLANLYKLNDEDVVTGYFGATTEKYLKLFQAEQGLPTYGIAGSLTRAAIARACGGSVPVPTGQISVYLTNMPTNAQFMVGQSIPITWNVENVGNRNTQTLLELKPIDVGGGVGGGIWQSPELPIGGSKQSYEWRTGEGYLTSKGAYRLTAYVVACEPSGCHMNYDAAGGLGRTRYAVSESIVIRVGDTANSNSISVTAPNGGEQWQIGSTNTVLWRPYQYNPDINPSKDVTAYLEKRCVSGDIDVQCEKDGFKTLGRLTDSGKASIHWNGYLEDDVPVKYVNHRLVTTGSGYYIRVVNRMTGATDRSDNPFSLVASGSLGVKVKLTAYPEGSSLVTDSSFRTEDNPILVITNPALLNQFGTYTVSWASNVSTSVCQLIYSGERMSRGESTLDSILNLPATGTRSIRLYHAGNQPFWSASVHCENAVAGSVQGSGIGYAYIKPSFSSLSIVRPNGGTVNFDTESVIEWSSANIDSTSVALYKNDQWYQWIVRDYPGGNKGYGWKPSNTLSQSDVNAGAVYKIYVNGRKTGTNEFIDDKSDAPFSFVTSSATPAPTVTLNQSAGTTTSDGVTGQPFTVSWSSTNATSCTLKKTNLKQGIVVNPWASGVSGSRQADAPTVGVHIIMIDCTGPGGTVHADLYHSVVSPTVAPVSTTGPGRNAMSCSSPSKTGLSTGVLACYGLWDYGGEFGNDPDMCETTAYGTAKTGCKVSTTACASGSATASRIITPSSASASQLSTIATNLQSTPEAVKAQIITLWEYTCDAGIFGSAPSSQSNVAAAAVLYEQLIGVLKQISELLSSR